MFEIAATDNVGVFEVKAKFLGVPLDKVELVFQVKLSIQPYMNTIKVVKLLFNVHIESIYFAWAPNSIPESLYIMYS